MARSAEMAAAFGERTSTTTKERLRTYQPLLAKELVENGRSNINLRGFHAEEPSPTTAALNAWEARKAAQRSDLYANAQAKADKAREAAERCAAEAAAKHDAEFEEMLSEVVSGILGNGITAETQAVVDDATRVYEDRKTTLYNEWREHVFDKIQSRIREGVSRRTVRELEEQLQAAAASYVNATNTKPLGVYLDVVLPEQYDPLAPLKHTVKIATGDIVDPLKCDLIKAEAERQLLRVPGDKERREASPGSSSHSKSTLRGGIHASGGTASGPSSARGAASGAQSPAAARHGQEQWGTASIAGDPDQLMEATVQLPPPATRQMLQTTKWGALQIQATPACHCINPQGLYVVRPPAPAALAMGASKVCLDDFNPSVQAQYRPSKHMGGGEARRDHINDILKWKFGGPGSATAPGACSGGDAWLEAKGKRAIPAPGGTCSGGP